jgi:Uma2 family endonuclease
MSTVAIGAEISVAQEGPPRKRWTRAECTLLQESGLLDGQRFELIDGELYNKMGKGRPHTIALTLVRNWLMRVFGEQFVETEPSIDVAPEDNPTSEPEPDIIILTKPTWEFSSNPAPSDIRLLVEISDTTKRFDCTTKGPLYARAGIGEYWVVDVNERSLIVHRSAAAGRYQSIETYREETIVTSGLIAKPFSVSELLARPRL